MNKVMLVFERVEKDVQLTVEERQELVMKGSVVSLEGYLICGSAFGRSRLKQVMYVVKQYAS